MNDWAVIIVIYLIVFISGPLIAILHELGHAFAYLLLTKPDKIDIYIGSYRLEKNAIQFKTGKLHFYIKRSFPFVKGIGLCKSYKAEEDYLKYIIILLAGSFFTFFSAGILALIVFNSGAQLLVQIACYVFLGFSALSLLSNLVSRELSKSYTNNLESDGKQLLFTLKIKNARPDYVEALQDIAKKEYAAAIVKLKHVLAVDPRNTDILRLLIITSLDGKQYDETANAITTIESINELSTDSLFYKGCLQSHTHQHDEAITSFSEVIKKNKNHILALNNIGYELIEKSAHQVAKRALDRAIKLSPEFDHPYSNLGYSKIVQGELVDGKALIDKCLQLNVNNANAYKALALYYLRLKNLDLAKTNIDKAIGLAADVDLDTYNRELKLLQEEVDLHD